MSGVVTIGLRCRGGFLTAFGTSRDCSAAANKYLHTMED